MKLSDLIVKLTTAITGNFRKPPVLIRHFSKNRLIPRIFLRNFRNSRGFRRLPIGNDDFKDYARTKPAFFTRTGGKRQPKMPFEDLIFFMLFHMKCSTPSALRRFFKDKGSDETMAQQSLSEAREKVHPEAIKHLFSEAVKLIVKHRNETWNGYRVFAVDGMKAALPDTPKILEFYGGAGKNADSPTAQTSALYDVLNDTLIDVAIEPLKIDERILAHGHISALLKLPVESTKC